MMRARETGHRASLNRRDLIVFEQRLMEAVAGLVPFKSHSIHFPRKLDNHAASYLKEEKKLLLPLTGAEEELLGVFVARGVAHKDAAGLIALWPSLCSLLTDNILLYKRSLCDPVTGLFTRHYLLRCMERDIETLGAAPLSGPLTSVSGPASAQMAGQSGLAGQAGLSDKSGQAGLSDKSGQAPGRPNGAERAVAQRGVREGLVSGDEEPRISSLGTFIIRFAALKDVVREFGYQFADELMTALADALTETCPEQAIAARTGDSEFAVHLPSAGQKACRSLALATVQALRKVYLVHPLRRERVGLHASVGYTLYPHDMTGSVFMRSPAEQARLVLRKARLAAALADETPGAAGNAENGENAVMAFGRILIEGGRILETLPLSRVVVSLGANMHAREGQRFSVWAPPGYDRAEKTRLAPLYKGEIVLMDVHENVSQAEIIHIGEPGWDIAPGDQLILLPEEQGSQAQGSPGEARLDSATGLLRHGDFLAKWAELRESEDSFALALVRLAPKYFDYAAELANSENIQGPIAASLSADTPGLAAHGDTEAIPDCYPPAGLSDNPAHFMAEAVRLCREELASLDGQKNKLGGRYGLNSLIFYHAGVDIPSLQARYEALAAQLEERLRLDVAVGIAPYPCLDFRKADALENCQKALEYAMLLPGPHVGALDTLALNISADKKFSQGDTFGAIREYQRSLLADEKNGMAWNSLGICLAGLSRHSEAERHFVRALDCDPADAMALYNLGYMHQSQNRPADATDRYKECLAQEPGHLFALVRLGQLAENTGDTQAARTLYEQAAQLPGGEGLTFRHFARLCISENRPDEAREHLHEALLHDPQDALAMALLARLYLDAEEDPEMAASFARQSVSLRPELKNGWVQLSRALTAMGREKEAREALLNAG